MKRVIIDIYTHKKSDSHLEFELLSNGTEINEDWQFHKLLEVEMILNAILNARFHIFVKDEPTFLVG